MSKTKKTVTVGLSGRETILSANCNLFGAMVRASQRDLNIKEVLSLITILLGPSHGLQQLVKGWEEQLVNKILLMSW